MIDEHAEPTYAQGERPDVAAVLATLPRPFARGEREVEQSLDGMAWRLAVFQNTRVRPMGRSFAGTLMQSLLTLVNNPL
jgi:hypothetical protein